MEYPQGSQKWLDQTGRSVGGSSIGYITGSNTFKSKQAYINDAILGERFEGSIATNFGNWGEDIIRLYLERVTKATIQVRGAVPYRVDNENYNIHYSMDGLVRTNVSKLRSAEFFPDEELTYLLEIKCPWTRRITTYKTKRVAPKGSCKVVKSYMDQVKMGLVIIEDAQAGLFIDCLLRVCTLSMLMEKFTVSPVHKAYHEPFETVLAQGVTLVYLDDFVHSPYFTDIKNLGELYDKLPCTFDFDLGFSHCVENNRVKKGKWEKVYREQTKSYIDFGHHFGPILSYLKDDAKNEVPYFRVEHLLTKAQRGFKGVGFGDLGDLGDLGDHDHQVCQSDNIIRTLENRFGKIDKKNLLGFIPWKLFDLKFAFIEKDPTFLDNKIEEMVAISKLFYECQGLTEDERIKKLDSYYADGNSDDQDQDHQDNQ